jgi:hypothetical protein
MTSKLIGASFIYFSFLVNASASVSEEERDKFNEDVAAVEETDAPTLPDLGAAPLDTKAEGQAPVLVKDTVAGKRDKNNFKPSEAISEDFAAPLPTDI